MHYHVIRALANYSQYPEWTEQILNKGALDILFRICKENPDELRVKVRTLQSSLRQHAHAVFA